MKIVLPGGTGQVGQILARAFVAKGHEVVTLSRKPAPSTLGRVVAWDGESLGAWASEVDGSDVVINLAGRSVNCRYTPANRRAILDSRVDSTHAVGLAIARATRPPAVWLQMSTATIYAHRFDAPNDEATGLLGGTEPDAPDTWRFNLAVATAWEKAATAAPLTPQTRLVLLRSAMVMSPDPGGVFATFLGLVRLGLGGQHGDGRQYVSWISDVDFIRAIFHLIDHDLTGPINLAAPNPLPNAEFLQALRAAWGTRLGLPATRLMLEIGTFLMQTETELILKSRRVIPTHLLQSGFTFQFPTWPDAAADLCRRWRGGVTMSS